MSAPAIRLNPLANPVYRNLLSAQIISLIGTGLTSVALALLAFDIAGGDAGVVLGTALAIKMIAYVLFAPVIGGMVHKLPRKPLLIALDLARAGIVVLLPFVDAVWQIYVLIFVLSICAAGFTPTFQSTIPDVLPDERQYTRALSLSRLAYDLENLLSPSLAALALLFMSFSGLFLFNAGGFVISALLVLITAVPAAAATTRRSQGLWHNTIFGVSAYLRTPRLRGLLALYVVVAMASSLTIIHTVTYVRSGLGLSQVAVAQAMMAAGGGSMLAALLLPRLLDRLADRPVMLTGGVLLVAALATGAMAPDFAGLLGLWFLLGIGLSVIQTPAGRLIRRSCHPGDSAAFFAAQFALSHGAWLMAYPLVGFLGARLATAPLFLILAGVSAAAVFAAALLWPARDPGMIEHSHPIDHSVGDAGDHAGLAPLTAGVVAGQTVRHSHHFVIDDRHRRWPRPAQ
ncbi:MAG: MFS transporter [Alphaproteobacteria bacterium]